LYLKAYSESYGMDCTSLCFANIFGPRSRHGVIYDFYMKLKKNPKKLLILGNGKQKKSYLYVKDTINASLLAVEKTRGYQRYNIGSEKSISVDEIAKTVGNIMGLNPKFEYTGGEQGWVGDVPRFLLDISKIKSLGWTPETSFETGVKKYIEWLETVY
jgi:UDP-glucose 4-epimerase